MKKKWNFSKAVWALIIPVFLITLWQVMGDNGRLNTIILPTPSTLVDTCKRMLVKGTLQRNLYISFGRVVKGYLIGLAAGLGLGIILGLSSRLNTMLSIITGLLRPVPIIAWVPILILFLGIDEEYKVAMIAIGSFWPILINTISGIVNVNKKNIEVANMFEKSRLEILLEVVLPEAVPSIFTGMRLGIGTAWSCVVGAEMLAAASGIGYLIMYARELYHPDEMYVGVLTIGLVGLLIDFVIMKIQRYVLRWM